MELKEQLKSIFHSDFPGIDVFINQVIKPIFGNDIIEHDEDFTRDDNYAERAEKAGIRHLNYVADITDDKLNSYNIGLFDVTLDDSKDIERSRVNIQQLIRSIVQSYTHILIVFHYENITNKPWRFSYAYKTDTIAHTTNAKRFTYVFGQGFTGRTAVERFIKLAMSQRKDEDFVEAFSVESLSDEFFDKYRELYADFVQYITGKRYVKEDNKWVERELGKPNFQYNTTFDCDDKLVRDYVKKMFGRIVFLYFLQRKGWLNGDRQYMHNLFYNSTEKDNFLDGVLEPLFFEVLNTDKQYRTADANALPGSDNIPYLNGGLFARDEIDELDCVFPEDYFKRLFDFLDSYNFTIDENDIDDAEIGIDPEMLGRIFENLLEDNKDKGAFYTPKEIVNYMCRESLIAYLQNGVPERSHELIRNFVESCDASQLNADQCKFLRKKLQEVKICDPAIGSGAFPMGLVNILSRLYIAMKADTDTSKMKRHIIENCIYGVDIEKGAVDIARLRFWLAMIVEEKEPMPLPNLHFKIMQGNSLLESINGIDLSDLTKTNVIRSIFDSTDTERENLKTGLSKYYNTSNHAERDRLFNEIINNVRRQIYAKDPNIDQTGLDPSANDKFFLWHTWFADVFDKGGFDIVIGNPPYLTEGKAPKIIFEAVKDSPYYLGKMNLWYMFACQGIDMLKDFGNLCFIATNNWITSSGARKLRNKIVSDARIVQLCDFRDYMIFETADIQTMIMQFKKDCVSDDYTFDLRNLLGNNFNDVLKLLEKESCSTNQLLTPEFSRKRMYNKFFTFSSYDDLLKKLANTPGCIHFSNEEIAQGIVFPQDFLNKKGQIKLGHHSIGDGIFGLSTEELHKLMLTDKEYSLIKPYFTSNEVKKYFTKSQSNSLWMIYTDSSFKNPSSLKEYPAIKAHLDQFVKIFTSDNKPYGLHRARDNYFFQGEKVIALRKCANGPLFSFSDGDCYLTQTFNIIKSKRVNLKYLTVLLNSKLIAFWLRNRGKMQGANYQLDKEPLQQIPIKIPNLDIQKQMSNLLENIIFALNAKEDFYNYQCEIDHIVYHLYSLTYDEVLIIDPETPITREEYENYK